MVVKPDAEFAPSGVAGVLAGACLDAVCAGSVCADDERVFADVSANRRDGCFPPWRVDVRDECLGSAVRAALRRDGLVGDEAVPGSILPRGDRDTVIGDDEDLPVMGADITDGCPLVWSCCHA